MTINDRLRVALEPIAPTYQDVYIGAKKAYIVFNYNSVGADFGDDCPSHERFLIQVHFYAPIGVNTLAQRKKIKAALAEAGTTWPTYTNAPNINGADKDGQHHIFECEFAQAAGAE